MLWHFDLNIRAETAKTEEGTEAKKAAGALGMPFRISKRGVDSCGRYEKRIRTRIFSGSPGLKIQLIVLLLQKKAQVRLQLMLDFYRFHRRNCGF